MVKKSLILFLCFMFLVSFASALEIDNVKEYDTVAREVTVYNSFFGIKLDQVGKARLNTPLHYKIEAGKDIKLGEFDLWAYEDYNDILKNIEIYDKTKTEWENHRINKNIDIKYKVVKNISIDEWENVCIVGKSFSNGTIQRECEYKITGSHLEENEVWEKVTPAVLKKNAKVTVGLFGDLEVGEIGEWIISIYGVRVQEWASYEGTGGTITTDGDYTIHTFTESGNFVVTGTIPNATILIVGGGAGGGYRVDGNGGGGGAGGVIYLTGRNISNGTYPVIVGIKGLGATVTQTAGGNGLNSSFNGNNSKGGGGGGPLNTAGNDGGSGGGRGQWAGSTGPGGLGLVPQGYDGGAIANSGQEAGAGGGGANQTGQQPNVKDGGDGGNGFEVNINGTLVSYGDGAGGSTHNGGSVQSTGGNGNGGRGQNAGITSGTKGVNGTGSGGGGGGEGLVGQDGGDGVVIFRYLTTSPDANPNVTLISPDNDTNYTTSPLLVNFSCYGSDDKNFTSMGLYINDVLDQLNASGINDTNYTFSKILTEDLYNWTCEGTDNESQTTKPAERYFRIHSTSPEATIHYPTGNIDYHLNGDSLVLNWTVSEAGENLTTHIINCTWEYNGVVTELNNTLCTQINTTTFIPVPEVSNLTFTVTDEFDLVNTTTTTWDIIIFESNRTFNNETFEGSSETFSTEIVIGAGQSLSQAIFEYNNTNYTTNILFSSGVYFVSSTITVPTVSLDTNISFQFYLIVDGITYPLGSETQTVFNTNFGACGGGDDLLLNISLLDEGTRTNLTGDIELNAQLIGKVNNEIVESINLTFTSVHFGEICLTPNSSWINYYLDVEIKYVSTDHAPELYHIQRADLTTYPKNLSLFDLSLNDSTEFLLKYEDDDLILVEGAVVQLQRKYIGSDLFEVVEAPLTSNLGTAIVHIDLNTNKYQATIVKDGVVLDIFPNLVFHCENELSGQCTEDLFGNIDSQNIITLEALNDFTYAVSEVNNTITTLFSIPSGSPSSVNIVLTQTDLFGNTSLCNQTVISSAGSIDCVYSNTIGDSVVQLEISKDGKQQAIKSYVIPEDGTLDFQGNNFFILLIMALSIIGMAFSSPEWIVINAVIILLLGGSLWLLNGMNLVIGLGSLVWLVIGAGILIKEIAKQEDR